MGNHILNQNFKKKMSFTYQGFDFSIQFVIRCKLMWENCDISGIRDTIEMLHIFLEMS